MPNRLAVQSLKGTEQERGYQNYSLLLFAQMVIYNKKKKSNVSTNIGFISLVKYIHSLHHSMK